MNKKVAFLKKIGVVGKVIEYFHRLYYNSSAQTWENTFWMGHKVRKIPFDLWLYQEIIHEIKPDLIIETGTDYGGSALYLAHLLDISGKGKVITIDIRDRENKPHHERIEYILQSSVDVSLVEYLKKEAEKVNTVMVILDSDHSEKHVYQELQLLSPLVTIGSYLIVEDGNINGHPVARGCAGGPYEAILRFLSENKYFEHDKTKDKFFVSFNPNGYLKRLK